MEILDSIDLSSFEPDIVAKEVNEYIAKHRDLAAHIDTRIRVSICRVREGQRSGSRSNKETLAMLVQASGGQAKWRDGNHDFDFGSSTYKYRGRAIHITSGEAIALYQQLVRRQPTRAWASYYSNMKARLGADFLRGVV